MASYARRVAKNGSVSHRFRIRMKGVDLSETFQRKRDGEAWATATETKIRLGDVSGIVAGQLKVADVFDHFLASGLEGRSDAYARDCRQRLAEWRSELGTLPVPLLTPQMVRDAWERIAARRPDRPGARGRQAPNTRIHYLRVLKRSFAFAASERFVERSPIESLAIGKLAPGRDRFLTDDEVAALLAACRPEKPARCSPRLYPLVVLGICTGAREGKLLGLLRRDLDLESRIVYLMQTKNKTHRSVGLSELAISVMDDWCSDMALAPDDFVFEERGHCHFPRKAWNSAKVRAGIEASFRFHDLRHTCASRLAERGATLIEIGQVLGHKSLQSTMRYAHLVRDRIHDLARDAAPH